MSYKDELNRLQTRLQELTRTSPDDRKQIKEIEIELKVLESNRLREKAKKWGIDLIEAVGPWETDANSSRWWISQDKHYAQAEKIIRETNLPFGNSGLI